MPQGGNTGYCGGAASDDAEGQVLVSLSRMNTVRGIDPVGFTMTAETGLVLANAQQEAAEISPRSWGAASARSTGSAS